MREYKAPEDVPADAPAPWIFLAGSIEMGAASPWQEQVRAALADVEGGTLLNPRRDAWDAGWEQSIDNPEFARQVNWELDRLMQADIAAFYFDPATRSPITLMEFGYLLGLRQADVSRSIVVACPRGFWRRGNVEVMCARAGVPLLDDLTTFVVQLRDHARRRSGCRVSAGI